MGQILVSGADAVDRLETDKVGRTHQLSALQLAWRANTPSDLEEADFKGGDVFSEERVAQRRLRISETNRTAKVKSNAVWFPPINCRRPVNRHSIDCEFSANSR